MKNNVGGITLAKSRCNLRAGMEYAFEAVKAMHDWQDDFDEANNNNDESQRVALASVKAINAIRDLIALQVGNAKEAEHMLEVYLFGED